MELSDYIPLNLICVVALGALGLRRLVRMERLHWLRVVILTGLLWLPALYLFFLAYLMQTGSYDFYYCPPDVDSGVYCVTEM